MKKLLATTIASITLAFGAHAATVDLTDGVFTRVTGTIIPNDPLVFTETADGVTFTFTAVNNLVGTTRFQTGTDGNMSNGLILGGGGGSTTAYSVSVSEDILLASYSGFNRSFLVAPEISASQGALTLISGAAFSATGNTSADAGTELIPGGPAFVPGGVTFDFVVTNASATTQGYLTGFEFEKLPVSTVPLPAGLPLLLVGLGALGVARRRTN